MEGCSSSSAQKERSPEKKETNETNESEKVVDCLIRYNNENKSKDEILKDEKNENHKNTNQVAFSTGKNKKINKKSGNITLKSENAVPYTKHYNSETLENDSFCYECCYVGNLVCCDLCIRSYHFHCLSKHDLPQPNANHWICPLCQKRKGNVDPSLFKGRRKIRTISTHNKKEKTSSVKQKTEGNKYSGKINVGENYQVPYVTTFFLNDPSLNYQDVEQSELVYSPYALEKMKEKFKSEGRYELVIKNDMELASFICELAKNWKGKLGCHPFTSEYAFKILHKVNYNPVKAIELLKSSDFNFYEICDPPVRKYENKWRPGDKRGQISDAPYPSSELINSYLNRYNELLVQKNKRSLNRNTDIGRNHFESRRNKISESKSEQDTLKSANSKRRKIVCGNEIQQKWNGHNQKETDNKKGKNHTHNNTNEYPSGKE